MANLKDLGEFGLIDRLSEKFKHQARDTVLPLGDDCAVYSTSPYKYQLISTDALVENIHFKYSTTLPEQLGQKAIAVNLSDIAAMGGTPTRVLITLGISKKISTSFLAQLYKGIHKACMFYIVELCGGDRVSAPKSFFINVTILGEAKRGTLFTRKGAKQGDLIFTTGTLGLSKSMFLGSKNLSQSILPFGLVEIFLLSSIRARVPSKSKITILLSFVIL